MAYRVDAAFPHWLPSLRGAEKLTEGSAEQLTSIRRKAPTQSPSLYFIFWLITAVTPSARIVTP